MEGRGVDGSRPDGSATESAPADAVSLSPPAIHEAWRPGKGAAVLGAAAVAIGLYLVSRQSYLLFHSLAELFSIVVACCIFAIVWNTRRLLDNSYLLFIGIAYLFVAALDLVHTLAYTGMGVFPGHGTNLPTQLWIAARYLESLSLLVATAFVARRLRPYLVLAGYTVVLALCLVMILGWRVFPDCFVEGRGLTPFKRISEYVICLILLASLIGLRHHRAHFDPHVLRLIACSIAVTVIAELAFTLYTDPYGPANLVGHYLKLLSFFLIYQALVHTALAKPYSVLFHDLAEARASLERTVAELERSNADLDQFARVASHDLQAPLALVADYVKLLDRGYGDRLDGDAGELIAGALEGVRRMQALIGDILAYSRVDSRGGAFEAVDISAVVDEALVNLAAKREEAAAEVSRDPLPTVPGDRPQLVQVFQNLLDNALKFRGDAPPRVHVGARREGAEWVLSVRDNGIGIPPEARERVFAMFERLHGASEYPGTGIGLALCRKIVERHGGRIWVESEPGQGTTFFFTLPAQDD